MDINNLKSYDKFIVKNSNIKKINISVYLVAKASFNDERLIESKSILVSKIKDKPLEWIDTYLGKNPKNKAKIAFLFLNNTDLYFFLDDGEDIKIIKKELFTHIFSDDYSDSYLIASHIW